MHLDDYNRLADSVAERLAQTAPEVAQRAIRIYRGVVLSVHGVRSRGEWQRDINLPLTDAGFLHVPLDIGDIGYVAASRPAVATRAAKVVADAYYRLRDRSQSTNAIGHSFGTIAIGKALQINPTLRLDRVILWGSVLGRSFPWVSSNIRTQVSALLNEACQRDPAPYAACVGCVLQGGGLSGSRGFREADEQRIFNRFHTWTNHTRLGTAMHCEDVWIPFLASGRPAD